MNKQLSKHCEKRSAYSWKEPLTSPYTQTRFRDCCYQHIPPGYLL